MTNVENLPDPEDPGSQDHNEHIRNSFNEWRNTVRHRIQPDDEERLNEIQDAVMVKDSERARQQLEATKANSSWLYEELMKHPTISAYIRELAIFGL